MPHRLKVAGVGCIYVKQDHVRLWKVGLQIWYAWASSVREGLMALKRYKEQGTDTFFGDYLYERTVPDGHFLRHLERLVDWEAFADRLVHLYRTRTPADVNVAKDDRRKKREGKPPQDSGARGGTKRKRRGGKKGSKGQDREYFLGYKMHNGLNAETEMITSLVVTAGNGHDGKQFPELVRIDKR